jgi:hypothetical protein
MNRKGSELREKEWKLIKLYLQMNERLYQKVEFSVRVGGGMTVSPLSDDWLKKMIDGVSRLKIDCVAVRTVQELDIIEVKERARAGSVGQLLVYTMLMKEFYNGKVNKLLLCESVHPDVEFACEKLDIMIIKYSVDQLEKVRTD